MHRRRLPLSISISHSHETAFCAVRPLSGWTIGADLEFLEPRSERFIRDFFTPAETAAWEESPPAEQALLANAIWSAKEAVLKALGLGLTVDTRGVDIHLSVEPADGPLRPREGDWRRFEAVCGAGIDVDGIPLSGLWSLRGRFVATLAARLPAADSRRPPFTRAIFYNRRPVLYPGSPSPTLSSSMNYKGMMVHYIVDERRIAHQTVDGEVIAIDFINGAYFSMRATAGEIWQMLAANVALDAVIALYQENSPLPADTLATEIQLFVSELLASRLLQQADASDPAQPLLSAIVVQRKPYSPPQLEKFEDMADLIMLDPVHDVGDAGWPHIPKHDA